MKFVLLFMLMCLGLTSPESCTKDSMQGRWSVTGTIENWKFTDFWEFGQKGNWCELKYKSDTSDSLVCKLEGRWKQSGEKLSVTYVVDGYVEGDQKATLRFDIKSSSDTVYLHLINYEEFPHITGGVRVLALTEI